MIRLGVSFLAVMALAGSYFYAFKKGGDMRESAIRLEISKAQEKAKADSLAAINKINNDLEKKTDELFKIKPQDDGAIAPVLRRTLDGLLK